MRNRKVLHKNLQIKKPLMVAIDLEGCLLPEIWKHIGERSGFEDFQFTTRDIKNYATLMRLRIENARKHHITLSQMQEWIAEIDPLTGAKEFLKSIRHHVPLLILSDTFYEFSQPLMAKLNYPTLLCHTLLVNEEGYIIDYSLRKRNAKAYTVKAMQRNGFSIIAIGDSYNDISMLKQADYGFWLHAPLNITQKYAQFSSVKNYTELLDKISYLPAFS